MYAFCISNFFVAKFAVISCYLLEKLSIGHTFGKEIDETSLLKWVNQILSINLQAGQYSNLIFFLSSLNISFIMSHIKMSIISNQYLKHT